MVSHVAPALTPDNGSPAFKVYSVDPVTFAVLDYTIFYANITDPSFQTTGPSWAKFYSAKEAYGPAVTPPLTDPAAELTPAFFHNLTVLFENDDGLFQQYLARGRRDDPTGLAQAAACTGSCQTSTICNIRAANSQYNCIPVTVGIDFTKRDETAGGSGYFAEQGGCDGSRAVALMQGLVGRKARR
jgi:sphingomyelin phosphodiesterase